MGRKLLHLPERCRPHLDAGAANFRAGDELLDDAAAGSEPLQELLCARVRILWAKVAQALSDPRSARPFQPAHIEQRVPQPREALVVL